MCEPIERLARGSISEGRVERQTTVRLRSEASFGSLQREAMCGVADFLNFDDVAVRISSVGCSYGAAREVWWRTIEGHSASRQPLVFRVDVLHVQRKMGIAVIIDPVLRVFRIAGRCSNSGAYLPGEKNI